MACQSQNYATANNNTRGILYTSPDSPSGDLTQLPLDKVIIDALVVDLSTRVNIIQRFHNSSKLSTPRAKYVFPIPAGAAVCSFEMRTADGRIVIGEAKEKTQAREEHERAIREGNRTALVDCISGDVFTISIGSIPGEQSITTIVTYVKDLMDDEYDTQVRLFIPMAVGERYGEVPEGMQDASAASPKTRVRFHINIQMQGSIESITSPSHQSDLQVEPYTTHFGRPSKHRAVVKLRSREFLTQDFVLLINASGLDRPRCFAEYDNTGAKTIAMQMTLIPKFKIPPLPSQEYLFLVDRSSSMYGVRIETAKRALTMLLRILPSQGTRFNVFSFGNRCDARWPQSMLYSQHALVDMISHVDVMDADYGGTEIQQALVRTLSSRATGMPTAVFVLTDGESHDVDATASTVKAAVVQASEITPLRVFVLGIGESVSTAMCEAIAEAGNGAFLMATAAESVVEKCATLVRAGRTFILKNITIDWGVPTHATQTDDPDPEVKLVLDNQVIRQSPSQIINLYPGVRLRVFAMIKGDNMTSLPKHVVLHGQRDVTSETLSFKIPVEQVKFEKENICIPLVHTLAARRIIGELDMLGFFNAKISIEQSKQAIIRLAEQYQLASRYTSFVAVEDPHEPEDRRLSRTSQSLQAIRHRRVDRQFLQDAQPHNFMRNGRMRDSRSGEQSVVQTAVDYAMSLGSAFFQTWFGPPAAQARGHRPNEQTSHTMPGGGDDILYDDTDHDNDHQDTDEEVEQDGYTSDDTFTTMSSLMSSITSSSSSPSDPNSRPPSPPPDAHARSPSPVLSMPGQYHDTVTHPSARPPTPPPTPLEPKVFDLTRLQNLNGSFALTPEFEQIVGLQAIEQGRTLGRDQTLWATALAIAYLQTHMTSHPQMLAAFVDKVREYVDNLPGVSTSNFDKLVVEAGAALSL